MVFSKKAFFPRKRRNRFCLKLAFFQSAIYEKYEVRLVDNSYNLKLQVRRCTAERINCIFRFSELAPLSYRKFNGNPMVPLAEA